MSASVDLYELNDESAMLMTTRPGTFASFAMLLTVATFAVAGCGGGGSKSSVSGTGAANVAGFCRDYTAAASQYEQSVGDVTDPAFKQFAQLLTKAEAEAPAAVKGNVSTMVSIADKALKDPNNAEGDLTQYSDAVRTWAAKNCTN